MRFLSVEFPEALESGLRTEKPREEIHSLHRETLTQKFGSLFCLLWLSGWIADGLQPIVVVNIIKDGWSKFLRANTTLIRRL